MLIALGTHPPMSDEAINQRLGITAQDRAGRYAGVKIFNHDWDNPQAAGVDRVDLRRRGRADLARAHARARRHHDEQARARVRHAAHRRADLPARGGRLLGRQQVPVSGDLGPRDHRHVPLAGRAHHQPRDHRHQVHAGARGGRQGGVDGAGRAQVREPGRRGQRPRRPLHRHARRGVERRRGSLESDPRPLTRTAPTAACSRARPRCTTSCGSAESARTSWSRSSPTAAS